MNNKYLLIGLASIIGMVIVGYVLLQQIATNAVGWQQRRAEEVSQAVGEFDSQITRFEEEQLHAAWERGDEATAQRIIQNIELREEATRAITEGIRDAHGLPATDAAPAAAATPAAVAVSDQQRIDPDRMAHAPALAAAAMGGIIVVGGILGTLLLLRADQVEAADPDEVAQTTAATQEDAGIDLPMASVATPPRLNPRASQREAIPALREAETLLLRVESFLEGAASSWMGGQDQRRVASEAFALAVQRMVEGGVTVSDAQIKRAQQWPLGSRSAAELRQERDDVIALLGVVQFLVAQEAGGQRQGGV